MNEVGLSVRGVSIDIEVIKGVKPGTGLGSSGATSAAVAKALNEIFGKPLNSNELVEVADQGESVAAGSVYYDNVAASLLGGIAVIVQKSPVKTVRIDPLDDISILLITPKHIEFLLKVGKLDSLEKYYLLK